MIKVLLIAGAVVLVLAGSWYAYSNGYFSVDINTQTEEDTLSQSMQHDDIQVTPIEHATAVLRVAGKAVYVDPTGGAEAFAGETGADIVLVTDNHGDHLSTSTLAAVVGSAVLVVPQAVKDQLPAELAERAVVLANGESTTVEGMTITAIPMYNLPGKTNSDFHTKGRGNGYVVEQNGARVYIAGDTAGTPEMRALTDIDVALVPMNLPYTMSVEEAAEAVLAFKPRQVFPYHYRGQGGLADVNKFKELVNAGDPAIEVVLGEWYPN